MEELTAINKKKKKIQVVLSIPPVIGKKPKCDLPNRFSEHFSKILSGSF